LEAGHDVIPGVRPVRIPALDAMEILEAAKIRLVPHNEALRFWRSWWEAEWRK
jgi:hypothetical protein